MADFQWPWLVLPAAGALMGWLCGALALQLLPAAVLISLVGFVESVSVAQTLAAKRRERIEPNQELVALGGANVAAALSGGFPVSGGFARSVVNFDAGAQSLRVGGAAVTATRRELALLNLLIANRGRIMSKDRLFDGLFGFENADVGTNTIELYVARLRKKLSGSGVAIETHRGLGYRLDLDG